MDGIKLLGEYEQVFGGQYKVGTIDQIALRFQPNWPPKSRLVYKFANIQKKSVLFLATLF